MASLLGLFLTLVSVAIAQGLFGFEALRSTRDSLATITEVSLPSVDAANHVNVLINDLRGKQYRYFLTSEAELPAAETNLANGMRALAEARQTYESGQASPAEHAAYQRFARSWARYSELWDGIPGLLKAGRRDDALRLFKVEMWRLSDEAGSALDDVVEIVRHEATEAAESASAAYRTARTTTLIAFAITVTLAIAATIYSLLCVVLPLDVMTTALLRLARGDRSIDLPYLNRGDEIGRVSRALDVFRAKATELEDAREATKRAEAEVAVLIRQDALTRLPNRRVFLDELEAVLGRVRNEDRVPRVLVINLKHFKPLNDLYGRDIGDLVLRVSAARLKEAVSAKDIVARLEGDEFAVLTFERPRHFQRTSPPVAQLAMRLIEAVQAPIELDGSRIEVGASVGIATWPTDGTDAEALLRAADLATRDAKKDASGTFRFFEPRLAERFRSRAAMEVDLRAAVLGDVIAPFYQPIVRLATGRVAGFEVLARWRDRSGSYVPPDAFIPLAEELNLISDLTDRLLRRACLDALAWPSDMFLSMNISAVDLKDPTLPSRLQAILRETGFSASRLELEITETAFIGDTETARFVLDACQDLGFQVALDDFGTGYSSLSHLRMLRFDKIKIDRSFVQTMNEDNESGKIVDAVLGLARSFGAATVAEGVESPDVLARLVRGGCVFGQGYLFGRAVMAEDAWELIRRGDQSDWAIAS